MGIKESELVDGLECGGVASFLADALKSRRAFSFERLPEFYVPQSPRENGSGYPCQECDRVQQEVNPLQVHLFFRGERQETSLDSVVRDRPPHLDVAVQGVRLHSRWRARESRQRLSLGPLKRLSERSPPSRNLPPAISSGARGPRPSRRPGVKFPEGFLCRFSD